MKSLSKSITIANRIVSDYNDKFLFNSSELLNILLQLRELRQYKISVTEIFEGGLQLVIADSVYQIFQSDDDTERNYQ